LGTSISWAGSVTITPTSLGFGKVAVGVKSTAKTATLTNNQTVSLTITSISANLGDYTQTNNCPISPSTLAAGASCTISISFAPATTGSRSATLTVTDNGPSNPTVSLTGTGVIAVTTSPGSLAYGNQAVGTTSAPQTVTLTNNQSKSITISSIMSGLTDYGYSTTCPLSPKKLAAYGSCTATISFTPAALGTRNATLSFNDDAVNTPQTVSMTGTGTSTGTLKSIAITPSSNTVTVGATTQLKATGTYSDGSTQDVTSTSTWASSSSAIATVSAGLLTGVADGNVNITASLSGITSPAVTADIGTAADFYVSTVGNDSWSGKLWDPNSTGSDGPFATIAKAQTAVQAILANPNGRTAPITVLVRNGTYYKQSLTFTSADSGTSTLQVNWQNYPNEAPVFSGGMVVTGWTNIGNGTYQATLPTTATYFENLFYNGQRRLRPRLGGGVGAYKRILSTVYLRGNPPPSPPPDPNCAVFVTGSGWQCFDRFTFTPGDLSSSWSNLHPPYPNGDIELVAFEWWSAPKMRIKSVDSANNIVYFTGPTVQAAQVHGFIPNHRYIVENVKDLLTTGQFFLDTSTVPYLLNYMPNPGENPLTDLVVVPQSTQVWTGTNLSYVTFKGLTFAHDNFTVPALGYASTQQEPALTGALSCYNCQYVVFDSDIIEQTSGSGIEFKTSDASMTTANNAFQNGALFDIGGMGIRVGAIPFWSDTDANTPQFTTIQNNLIEGYARVFPSGVGIVQGSGHDNTYTHNDIYDGYHSAIEICLAPSCSPGHFNSSGTFNNVVSFNHVFDIFEGVTDDGGAIYFATGGPSYVATGNQVLNNKVHDTTDPSIIDSDGYGGDAINLDGSTGSVLVENNLVYRVSGMAVGMTHASQLAGYPNTIQNNIFSYVRTGMISNGNPYPTNVCPTSAVDIYNTTNNLFYFDRLSSQSFFVQEGCEYACGYTMPQFHNFQSNLYWRLDGGFSNDVQGFHTQPQSAGASLCGTTGSWKFYVFKGWQMLGEDFASIATRDPGFKNPSYPNDDYTLPNGSPGVGFIVFNPNQAGRVNPLIKPGDPIDVPATFQTTTYNPASDY
jgi:hypothetical protein